MEERWGGSTGEHWISELLFSEHIKSYKFLFIFCKSKDIFTSHFAFFINLEHPQKIVLLKL